MTAALDSNHKHEMSLTDVYNIKEEWLTPTMAWSLPLKNACLSSLLSFDTDQQSLKGFDPPLAV